MRNLLVLQDIIHALPLPLHKNDNQTSSRIVSYACDYGISTLLLLTSDGYLFSYSFTADGAGEERSSKCPFWLTRSEPWKLNIDPNNPNDQGWFYVSIVAETGTIVCISHSGSIISIKENIGYESWSDIVEQEGDVDGGIATAQWCPDQTSLILVTKNNTILSMTTSWDVLQEIPIESILPDTSCSISWRSDGEFFSLTTTDNDNITSARVFNKDLELHATGRNLGEGAAAVLKSLGSPIAFGANGSLIAVTQAIKNKHQVSFIEKNGLRHGEFEIKCPPVPNGWDAWKVSSLHWDLPSTLLSVGLKAISNTDSTGDNSPGIVQIYYRNNYHWYLKQQWTGIALSCIGFDNELSGRVYLSQITSIEEYRFPVIRIIDTTWDMYSSNTVDCTTAVIDGSDLLLTPLGKGIVPPPMCKYKLTLPSPCLYVSFWNPIDEISNSIVTKDENEKVWGMACLCDDNIICLHFGNYLGKTIDQYNINIVDVIDTFQLGNNVNSFFSCRSIIVSELSEFILAICVVRSRMIIEGFNDVLYEDESLTNDELIIFHYDISISKVIKAELRTNINGTITRLITWPNDSSSIGMGININAESFEVLRINLNIDNNNDFGNITSDIKNSHESTVSFPELITHLGIVSNNSSGDVAMVGLSNKNRLFCGDILLIVGASSFSINERLGIFLYATIGTRPSLHFMAIKSLLALDQVLGQEQTLCDMAESRPLERGARITACINGDSKVIIQLPRGNLEAFEPRPLILLRARQLLNENKFLECLILLRRQKVDLNYVVDYNPKLFMANIDELVKGSVGINSELLSLLLSSLSAIDTSIFKYKNPNKDMNEEVSSLYTSDNKVNFICSAIRDSLIPLLKDGNHGALYPTLCTYAHQKPPLLVDAFLCIRMACSNKLDNTTSLSSTKVQGAIKYLAFLADGKLLFDAAVGSCDYEMAKAVARQSQMDPKIYLPLLESFECIGRGFDTDSLQYYMMNYTVNNHLNRHEEMITFASKVLYSYYMEIKQQDSTNLNSKLSNDISEMCDYVLNITSVHNLYSHTIPIFTRIALSSNKKNQSKDENIIYLFLSKLKLSHGNFCVLKMDYKEAIVAFMTAVPPHASDAIRVCRLESNWEYALTIAGRYSHLLGSDNSQQRLAQDIVAEYRENLEFNNENHGEENFNNSANNISELGHTFANNGDKSIEAAQLCLDYCDDAESAVAILILSQKWLEAASAAMKKNRNDLLHDEIGPMARIAVKELLKNIGLRVSRQIEIVTELKKLWLDPQARLDQVASTDPTLVAELNGVDKNIEDDTKSEFSLLSMQSGASNISGISNKSGRSGTSSVSVLSNLSATSAKSIAIKSDSSFAIEGLEHSLLSRGDSKKHSERNKDDNKHGRKEKKAQKKREKAEAGRDVWGVQNESTIARELLYLGNGVGEFAKKIKDLCDLLILINGPNDMELVLSLQHAANDYVLQVQLNPPPIAPNYPPEWLEKRLMSHMRHFQDLSLIRANSTTILVNTDVQLNSNGVEWDGMNTKNIESWWEKAANGIRVWHTYKRVSWS